MVGRLEASADAAVRDLAGSAARVPVRPLAKEPARAADLVREAVSGFAGALAAEVRRARR